MYRAIVQTVGMALVLGLTLYFLSVGVSLGTTHLGGWGGVPSLTQARLHPRTLADLGTDVRLAVYVALAVLALLLASEVALSYRTARGAGYRVGQRLVALQRVPGVRGAIAWAGALLALLRGGASAAAAGAPAQVGSRGPSGPRVALVRVSPSVAPRDRGGDARRAVEVRAAPRPTPRPGRVAARRVVTAVRYVVQQGDTLRGIAQRYYNDEMRWPEIYRASIGIVQPGGVRLDNPDLIIGGEELHVPLPAANVAVDGDHVVYIAQQGDTPQGIAARFLGDWRRYNTLATRVGAGLRADPDHIYPGMQVYLPAAAVATRRTVYEHSGPRVAPRQGRPTRPLSRGGHGEVWRRRTAQGRRRRTAPHGRHAPWSARSGTSRRNARPWWTRGWGARVTISPSARSGSRRTWTRARTRSPFATTTRPLGRLSAAATSRRPFGAPGPSPIRRSTPLPPPVSCVAARPYASSTAPFCCPLCS